MALYLSLTLSPLCRGYSAWMCQPTGEGGRTPSKTTAKKCGPLSICFLYAGTPACLPQTDKLSPREEARACVHWHVEATWGGGGTDVHKTGSRGYVYKFTRFCYSYVVCLLCVQVPRPMQRRYFKTCKEPRNQFQGIDFASLCACVGWRAGMTTLFLLGS